MQELDRLKRVDRFLDDIGVIHESDISLECTDNADVLFSRTQDTTSYLFDESKACVTHLGEGVLFRENEASFDYKVEMIAPDYFCVQFSGKVTCDVKETNDDEAYRTYTLSRWRHGHSELKFTHVGDFVDTFPQLASAAWKLSRFSDTFILDTPFTVENTFIKAVSADEFSQKYN